MKAIVQHNFTSGMGDFINCIYEYFITCNRLKQCGITHFTLFFYLEKNVYLHKDQFWDIFYEKTFLQLFDVVEIIEKSIETDAYENCVCITGNPGKHLWDLLELQLLLALAFQLIGKFYIFDIHHDLELMYF